MTDKHEQAEHDKYDQTHIAGTRLGEHQRHEVHESGQAEKYLEKQGSYIHRRVQAEIAEQGDVHAGDVPVAGDTEADILVHAHLPVRYREDV